MQNYESTANKVFPEGFREIRIQKKYEYIAYKNGSVVGREDDMASAKKLSDIVERVWTNEEEYKEYWNKYTEYQNAITEIWTKALREEYRWMSDALFNVCYSKAYEDGHSAGYDEVANEMIGVAEFAERVLATV